jgi:hypothetical protein
MKSRGVSWRHEKYRKAYRVLWGCLKEGDHIGNLGVGENDNIEMDIKYVGGKNMDCIHLARNKDQ